MPSAGNEETIAVVVFAIFWKLGLCFLKSPIPFAPVHLKCFDFDAVLYVEAPLLDAKKILAGFRIKKLGRK